MKRFTRIFLTFPATEQSSWLEGTQGVAWQPLVDLYDCGEAVLMVVELPGVAQEDIRITVQNGVVNITGSRHKQIPSETVKVHQMEIPHGPFARAVQLPPYCDFGGMKAQYESGYLVVRIPRMKNP